MIIWWPLVFVIFRDAQNASLMASWVWALPWQTPLVAGTPRVTDSCNHAPTRQNTTKASRGPGRKTTLNIMSNHCKFLAPHIVGALVVISGLTNCCGISVIVVISGLIALWKLRFPQLSKERVDAVLEPGKPSIIAHKCAAGEAPENTIAGIKEVSGQHVMVLFCEWRSIVCDLMDQLRNVTRLSAPHPTCRSRHGPRSSLLLTHGRLNKPFSPASTLCMVFNRFEMHQVSKKCTPV